jgi:hypothetical protein
LISPEGNILASAFARNDGTIDLAAALAYCVSIGGNVTLIIPTGRHDIAVPLLHSTDILAPGITLRGACYPNIISQTGASCTIRATAAMDYMFSAATCGLKIENIDFNGNNLAEIGVQIQGFYEGVPSQTAYSILRDVLMRNCTVACLNVDGGGYFMFDHIICAASATGIGAVFQRRCTSWTINNGSAFSGMIGIRVVQAQAGNILNSTLGGTVTAIDVAYDGGGNDYSYVAPLNIEGNYFEVGDGGTILEIGTDHSLIKGFSLRKNIISGSSNPGNYAVHLIGQYALNGSIDENVVVGFPLFVKNEASANGCVYGPSNRLWLPNTQTDCDDWTGFKQAVDKNGAWQAGVP